MKSYELLILWLLSSMTFQHECLGNKSKKSQNSQKEIGIPTQTYEFRRLECSCFLLARLLRFLLLLQLCDFVAFWFRRKILAVLAGNPNQPNPINPIDIQRNSNEFIGIHRKSSEVIGIHRNSQKFIGIHRGFIEVIRIHRKFIKIHRNSQKFIGNS